MDEWVRRLDGLVLGRTTYEIFAAHWPKAAGDDPLGNQLNRVPKYVASRTLERGDWSPTTVIQDVPEEIDKLKGEAGEGELQVHGSGGLIQTLLEHRLIDEFRIWTFPLVLGTGKRLFGDGAVPTRFELTETKTSTTGVVLHVYRTAGRPSYGSIAIGEPSGEEFSRHWKGRAPVG